MKVYIKRSDRTGEIIVIVTRCLKEGRKEEYQSETDKWMGGGK